MSDSFHWFNPPDEWSGDAAQLELRTGANTDFWRETFYGFVRDNGHGSLPGCARCRLATPRSA
jgi:regulation of enolase protein 1 (concanavalin A-like superfamily)